MTELIVGRYKFYPYEFDKRETPTLDELVERGEKIKAKNARPKKSATRSKRRSKE